MIAQIPTVSWSTTGAWMIGLIGCLAVANLILGVANAAKKLFAKHPPVDEQLARIESDYKHEMAQASLRCEARHESVKAVMDEKFRDLALERARSIGDLHEKINTVAADVAFIRGKLSKFHE